MLVTPITFSGYGDRRLLSLVCCAHSTAMWSGGCCRLSVADPTSAGRKKFHVLAILGEFTYFNSFADEVRRITKAAGLGRPDFTLPLVLLVGIRSYTFQTIGTVIDVHCGLLKPESDVLEFFLVRDVLPAAGRRSNRPTPQPPPRSKPHPTSRVTTCRTAADWSQQSFSATWLELRPMRSMVMEREEVEACPSARRLNDDAPDPS